MACQYLSYKYALCALKTHFYIEEIKLTTKYSFFERSFGLNIETTLVMLVNVGNKRFVNRVDEIIVSVEIFYILMSIVLNCFLLKLM